MNAAGETFGTALLVGDTWYARLVDGGGVLIPLSGSAVMVAALVHEGGYSFSGRLIADHRGVPREFSASTATRIGVGSDD